MDYTPYKFTYFPKAPKKPKPPNRNFNEGMKGEKKGNAFNLILVIIILVSLVVSLVLIGKESGRNLIEEAVDLITKKDTLVYYTVCLNPTEYKSDAEALSRKVRYSGCGGYVFNENNRYYVSLATYLTENEAKEVSAKNENTTYLSHTFDRKKYLSTVTDDGITKRVLECVENGINALIEISFLYEKKELTLVEATHRVESVKNSALNLKMELDSVRAENATELNSFLSPFIGTLNVEKEEQFLANVRFTIAYQVTLFNRHP